MEKEEAEKEYFKVVFISGTLLGCVIGFILGIAFMSIA